MTDLPPGYYPDPERPGKNRRWTGTAWEPLVDRHRGFTVILVAAALWLVALLLPAYPVTDGDAVPGLMCVAFGAFFGASAFIAWAGQFLVVAVALISVLRRRDSWLLKLLPPIIGLTTVAAATTLIGMDIPLDEAGYNRGTITGLGIGFYLWAASLLLVGLTPWLVHRTSESLQH